MAGFDDIEFPLEVSYGMKGGPVFHTTVVQSSSGYEQRNQDWTAPRLKWEAQSEAYNAVLVEQLLAFFRARGGRARGFRFRDWSDWYVGMDYSAGPTLANNGSPMQFGTGDGATTVFQLSKTYTDSVNPTVRKVTRPITGTLTIYVNGSVVGSGFTIDYTTGLVTFSSAPAAAAVLAWAGQYDIPARFDADDLGLTMDTAFYGTWTSMKVIEIRE